MINMFKEELFKIVRRRKTLYVLMFTAIAHVIVMISIAYLDSHSDRAVEGLFQEKNAHGIFGLTRILVMLWTVIPIGQELSHGYVNRAVLSTSRNRYFMSKLVFCSMLSIFFAALGLVSFWASIRCSAFSAIEIDGAFVVQYAVQLLLANLLYSFAYMGLVFTIRSPMAAGLTAYFWPQVEAISREICKGELHIDLYWLPFQLVESVHMKPSSGNSLYDYVPLNNPLALVPPLVVMAILTYLSYRWFLKRDLTVISD
ncbi:MAG: hypothetical protein ORN54_06065 [Cyclobacteriaceae bacterium]|nr:hypothetical protein [Cyclobacteriaceae bacterium]